MGEGRVRPDVLLLVTGLLISVARCQAQDALRNALSLDQVLLSAQTVSPEQPHLGPVQMRFGAFSGVELNDNISLVETNPLSDVLLKGGVLAGLAWPATTQSELRFGLKIGYVHYFEHSQNDHPEVAPDSALSWQVMFKDGSVTFFDQFSYLQDVINEGALSGVTTFSRFDNTVGARVNWQPKQWLIEAGYSHNDFFSDSAELQYLDRSSEFFFFRLGWRFAENTQGGLEASASLTHYREAIQSDNWSISVGPYLEWQITQNLRGALRGGPTFYEFESSGQSSQGSELNSYYVGLDVTHQLTDFLSQRLIGQRDVRLGLNQGSDYLEQFSMNYTLSLALTRHTDLGLNFTYEHGTQPFEVPIQLPSGVFILRYSETFDRFGVGPSFSWRATDKLSTSIGYYYWLRDSNLPDRGYTQNSLFFNVSYTF